MDLRPLTVICLLCMIAVSLPAQIPPAKDAGSAIQLDGKFIVERSIEYHDPNNTWSSSPITLELRETRPDGPDRKTILKFDNSRGTFSLEQDRDGDMITRWTNGDSCSHTLNGSQDISKEDTERLRLDCDRTLLMRDYYGYLYGLPVKLQDAGTIIDRAARMVQYDEREMLQVRVTYDAEVGGDTWYLYFDPSTYALSGYRFYHDEEANDGEYIILKGEAVGQGLRLPKERTWYVHKDGKLLGSDIIEAISNQQ